MKRTGPLATFISYNIAPMNIVSASA
jgi:hypothetical protein